MEQYFIFICGGSFQGKSVVALDLSTRLDFSGVVSTDVIRNLLKVVSPDNKVFSTTTFLMNEQDFNEQKIEVSKILKELVYIYEKRGEKIIFEGMHFSNELISWLSTSSCCKIFLNNKMNIKERILYKSKTRKIFRLCSHDSSEFTFGAINENNVENTAYAIFADRINEIHNSLLFECEKAGFKIIDFTNINDAKDQVFYWAKSYF